MNIDTLKTESSCLQTREYEVKELVLEVMEDEYKRIDPWLSYYVEDLWPELFVVVKIGSDVELMFGIRFNSPEEYEMYDEYHSERSVPLYIYAQFLDSPEVHGVEWYRFEFSLPRGNVLIETLLAGRENREKPRSLDKPMSGAKPILSDDLGSSD
jgi:hypothetical protein